MECWKSGFAIRKSPSSTCGKPTVLMPTEQQNTFTMRLPIRLNEKRLSQFAYNERSRSGWTSDTPIKKCYPSVQHVCYPCLRSEHPSRERKKFLVVLRLIALPRPLN